MKQSGQSGFTIVELIVVIIVIGLLATITSMMYSSSQQQASDTRIRDAADKFSDAIQLWSAQNSGAKPKGGSGSTTPASATTGCADGANGFQDDNYGSIDSNYQCTVGDAMVATGYLTVGLFASLPTNTYYTNSTKMIFMIYPCANNANQWNLLFTLQSPATGDTSNINSVLTACGTNPASYSPITTYGMRGVIPIKFS